MINTDTNNLVLWYQKTSGGMDRRTPRWKRTAWCYGVSGGVERERIQVNEESLWDGGSPATRTTQRLLEALPKVQQLLFEDKKRRKRRKLADEDDAWYSRNVSSPINP